MLEEYLELGFNYRMTDIQAAIGLVQLDKLDQMVAGAAQRAARYHAAARSCPGVRTVSDPPNGTTNYQSFWVRARPDFRSRPRRRCCALLEHGISARRGIMAAHLEPAYADHPAKRRAPGDRAADPTVADPAAVPHNDRARTRWRRRGDLRGGGTTGGIVAGAHNKLPGDWTDLVVVCAGTSWDGVTFAVKHIARQLTAYAPVLYVDPPLPSIRARRGQALEGTLREPPLRLIEPGLARVTPIVNPGRSRCGLREVARVLQRRAIRKAVDALGARPRPSSPHAQTTFSTQSARMSGCSTRPTITRLDRRSWGFRAAGWSEPQPVRCARQTWSLPFPTCWQNVGELRVR